MLERLHVKNIALIDETEAVFGKGLNILTGETGAGKSILIDSIQLALGAKADKSMIRKGAEYAFVELSFQVTQESQNKKLRELEIFPTQDREVVLQRRILPGKSISRINGETVSGKQLKDAASILIDIYGQNEHQSLLQEKNHLEILDEFCGSSILEIKTTTASIYHNIQELKEKLKKTQKDDKSREREMELAAFECREIGEARLQEGEDSRLEAEFSKMQNIRLIGENTGAACEYLDSFDGASVSMLIDRTLKKLMEAAHYDAALEPSVESLVQIQDQLRETSRFLQHYSESLELDEQEYHFVEERLDTINRLKNKYGNSICEILDYEKKQQEFLNEFEDYEQYIIDLENQINQKNEQYLSLCQELSAIRQKEAALLQEKMQNALKELNFNYVEFEIELLNSETYFSKDGQDKVRFLISLNTGEDKKPLSEVASGGELSRIMLALKTVMADKDHLGTLIFDEIDAGISGKTAWKVSEKLAVLGERHQVICITHLAQIAAMADCHFMIKKIQTEDSTRTLLFPLDEEGMIAEIARLIGSDTITETVLQNARELKELATHTKQY